MDHTQPDRLLHSLVSLPRETEWVEFKKGLDKSDTIAKYVSALSNSIIVSGKECAYLVIGVEDGTHEVIGTTVRLAEKKEGNETFLHWLNKMLQPSIQLQHMEVAHEGHHVEILRIASPYVHPVRFNGIAYIRIDSSLHPLSTHPAKEAAIWQAVSRFSFERQRAGTGLSEDEIKEHFHYHELTSALSKGRLGGDLLDFLESHDFIINNLETGCDPTNLLVLVAAKNFGRWPGYERKGLRIIVYKSNDKLTRQSDTRGRRGYFAGFQNAFIEIMSNIASDEVVIDGVRQDIPRIPEIAVREILANAIVHQDLTDMSSGPLVEIYPDRVVITNPGKPLVEPENFVNAPSKSRNNAFTDMMRLLGVCEQRGSGIDRAFTEIERLGLPPATVRIVEGSTVITLFGPRKFAELTKEERVWACYWHACLCVERNQFMSNASLRTRFKLNERQYPQVSEVISETITKGMIRPLNEDQANRNARYVPNWY